MFWKFSLSFSKWFLVWSSQSSNKSRFPNFDENWFSKSKCLQTFSRIMRSIRFDSVFVIYLFYEDENVTIFFLTGIPVDTIWYNSRTSRSKIRWNVLHECFSVKLLLYFPLIHNRQSYLRWLGWALICIKPCKMY